MTTSQPLNLRFPTMEDDIDFIDSMEARRQLNTAAEQLAGELGGFRAAYYAVRRQWPRLTELADKSGNEPPRAVMAHSLRIERGHTEADYREEADRRAKELVEAEGIGYREAFYRVMNDRQLKDAYAGPRGRMR